MGFSPEGSAVSGANLPLSGTGGLGWLSSLYLEMKQANQTLSEGALILQCLQETNRLLTDIAVSVAALQKR